MYIQPYTVKGLSIYVIPERMDPRALRLCKKRWYLCQNAVTWSDGQFAPGGEIHTRRDEPRDEKKSKYSDVHGYSRSQ